MSRVKIIHDGEYQVESSKLGTWYTVKYCGSGDGDPDYVATWECDCAGYRHRGECKHVALIGNLTGWLPDYNVAEVIEEGWIKNVELAR